MKVEKSNIAHGKSYQKPAGFRHCTFGIVLAIADSIVVGYTFMSLLKSNLRSYHAYVTIILYFYLSIRVFNSSLATYYWYLYPNKYLLDI